MPLPRETLRFVSGTLLFALAVFGSLIGTSSVLAQGTATTTWRGATSTNWATATNWTGTTPTAGANLQFVFGTAANQNTNNNVGGAAVAAEPVLYTTNPAAITFNTGGFTLGGTGIELRGDIVNSVGNNTINLSLDLRQGGGTAPGGGTNTQILAVNVAASTQLTIGGLVQSTAGTHVLSKTGAGTLVLSGNNTYAAGTTVERGHPTGEQCRGHLWHGNRRRECQRGYRRAWRHRANYRGCDRQRRCDVGPGQHRH